MSMIILLTGKPGCGKSTVIEKFIALHPEIKSWTLTREIRDKEGLRQGFRSITSAGADTVIAHKNDIKSDALVGDYRVDVDCLSGVFVPAFRNAYTHLTVLDEIGLMQFLADSFISALDAAFAHSNDVQLIATVNSHDKQFAKYRESKNVLLIEVTHENRDELPEVLQLAADNFNSIIVLSRSQQTTALKMLCSYVLNGQRTQINKLIQNALDYVMNKKIQVLESGIYSVEGRHGSYKVKCLNGQFSCTCDLFNGRGLYESSECSHIQAVKIASS